METKKKEFNVHVRESLKHWFRIRGYLRTLPKSRSTCDVWGKESITTFYAGMLRTIGELISSEYCALCNAYYTNTTECSMCPLFRRDYWCLDSGSIYERVVASNNVAEWLENSKLMIKALWECRYLS